MGALSLYRAVSWLSWYAAAPVMRSAAIRSPAPEIWQGRLGSVPKDISEKAPWDIWVHAVSVGETGVAAAIIDEIEKLDPSLKILVSSTTPAGIDHARRIVGDRCGVMASPLDFPQAVSKTAEAVKPSLYACIETELWPSMLTEMERRGAAAILLNGRISSRSFPRYRKIKHITADILNKFSLICASSKLSCQRLKTLGAEDERVILTGNAKYQALLNRPDPKASAALASLLGISEGTQVMVAGSIRKGDEKELLKAWKAIEGDFPNLRLIIAPRHLENTRLITRFFQENSVPITLWSAIVQKDKAPGRVTVVDEMGILFHLYGIAQVSFVGGSFAAKGGQNILEPAAWACPVFYGPHVENFEDAAKSLEALGANGQIRNGRELAEKIRQMLLNPALAAHRGEACRKALSAAAADAATKQAEAVLSLFASKRAQAKNL